MTSSISVALLVAASLPAEDLGATWGTETRERLYYPITNLPIPEELVLEAGAFTVLPDDTIAVAARRGDIWLIDGADEERPEPTYELFATGLDEIFGLEYRDEAFYVTQSCELTRISDTDGNGSLSRVEYEEAGLERYGVSFDEYDANGDGETSFDEYIALYEKHHPADAGIES